MPYSHTKEAQANSSRVTFCVIIALQLQTFTPVSKYVLFFLSFWRCALCDISLKQKEKDGAKQHKEADFKPALT